MQPIKSCNISVRTIPPTSHYLQSAKEKLPECKSRNESNSASNSAKSFVFQAMLIGAILCFPGNITTLVLISKHNIDEHQKEEDTVKNLTSQLSAK